MDGNVTSALTSVYMGFVALFGLLGNFVCIVVFSKSRTLRQKSCNIYLLALACADFIFSFTILSTWLNTFKIYLVLQEGMCELLSYLASVCSSLAAYFVVALTVERFIVVWYPFVGMRIFNKNRSVKIVLIITVLCLLYNSYLLFVVQVTEFISEVDNISNYSLCDIKQDAYEIYKTLTIADYFLSFAVPFLVTLVLNIGIMTKLAQSKHFKLSNTSRPVNGELSLTGQESHVFGLVNDVRSTTLRERLNGIVHDVMSNSLASRRSSEQPPGTEPSKCFETSRRSISRNFSRTTPVLLSVSLTYCILNLPSYSLRIFHLYREGHGDQAEDVGVFDTVAYMLYYTQAWVNIVLYTTIHGEFRRVLPCTRQHANARYRSIAGHLATYDAASGV